MTDRIHRSSISVVETVYHRQSDGLPLEAVSRYFRSLKTSEQPYVRKTVIGPVWKPLDTGWLKECSLLVLQNLEGLSLRVNPTEEEQQKINSRVLEVASYDGHHECIPLLKVLPGESTRLCPIDLGALRLRCANGEAEYKLTVFPE